MTKKRKRFPSLQQKLERPWCYYCERDFDDLKILISHQKAKHFKCERCGRRLNTAGGLSVHMNQVHKETLTHVENSVSGRQSLDIEIFGMEGVPAEIVDQHIKHVTQTHFEEETERARLTGNPIRGLLGNEANGGAGGGKRPRVVESLEEIETNAEIWRREGREGAVRVKKENVAKTTAPAVQPPFPPAAPATLPPGYSAPPTAFPPSVSPSQQTPGTLPTRPSGFGAPGAFPTGPDALSASVDALIGEVRNGNVSAAAPDAPAAAPAGGEGKKDKKEKKGSNMKLIFFDETLSPEEKMAGLPRFKDFVRV